MKDQNPFEILLKNWLTTISETTKFYLDHMVEVYERNVQSIWVFLIFVVLPIIAFVAWKFSDRYLHQKLMRDSLGSPLSLYRLMLWQRREHEFIIGLRRELPFLAKWFKQHTNL